MLIQKCDSPSLLSQALAEKRVSGDLAGVTALYCLMAALHSAAFSKSWPELQSILTFSTMLIQKCDSPSLLSQALAEKRVSGYFAGTTALCYLMMALHNTAFAKSWPELQSILTFSTMLIQKCDSLLLSQGLAEKIVSGDFAGTTALCYLMMALHNTAFSKSWPELQSILTFSTMLIQKCDSPSLLSQALAEKRVSGDLAGVTALYCLMAALHSAAFSKSWPELQSILTFSTMLIQKCDSPSLLSQALAEKRVSGDFAGTTALYCLMEALNHTA